MAWMSRVVALLERRFGAQIRKTVDGRILDRSYRVIDGSIRGIDYDDAWLLALGSRSRVVFDIGCNLGQSSLLLLYPGTVRRIVMVDANPASLSVAAENLITNGLSPFAVFVSAFVSDRPDQSVDFYSLSTGGASSMYAGHAASAAAAGSHTRAPTTTVDALAEIHGLSPDLIKVDVEGAEGLVLEGARRTAESRQAKLLIEMHSNPELTMADNARRILEWCRQTSYTAWYLKDKTELQSPDTIAHRGRCHLLLAPEEAPFPEYLRSLEQGAPLERVELPSNPAYST